MSSSGLPCYRTAADVRAIPNEQWEAWIVAASVPTERFLGDEARHAAFHIMQATRRRLCASS